MVDITFETVMPLVLAILEPLYWFAGAMAAITIAANFRRIFFG